eukprot:scaffold153340_cov41-Tisochrysis_lutea.AAC.2
MCARRRRREKCVRRSTHSLLTGLRTAAALAPRPQQCTPVVHTHLVLRASCSAKRAGSASSAATRCLTRPGPSPIHMPMGKVYGPCRVMFRSMVRRRKSPTSSRVFA